jgi:WD40 repeat protein
MKQACHPSLDTRGFGWGAGRSAPLQTKKGTAPTRWYAQEQFPTPKETGSPAVAFVLSGPSCRRNQSILSDTATPSTDSPEAESWHHVPVKPSTQLSLLAWLLCWLLLGALATGCASAPGARGADDAAGTRDAAAQGSYPTGLAPGEARFVPQTGLTGRADAAGADLSPDGRLALIDGESGWFEVWELATGMIIRTVRNVGSGRGGSQARFLADSQRVACARGSQVVVIDLVTGKTERVIEAPARAGGGSRGPKLRHLAVAAEPGRALAAYEAGFDTIMAAVDLAQGTTVATFELDRRVDALALSSDGRRALTAVARGGAAEITLWDADRGQEIRSWEGHDRGVERMAFSRRGDLAATVGSDRELILWDVATGKARRRIEHKWGPAAPAFSPDGKLVATGDVDGIYLWSVATGERTQHLPSRNREPAGLIFADEGDRIVAVGETGPLRVFDVATGKRRRRLEAPWGVGIAGVAAHETGHAIAATANGLRIWDLASGRLVAKSRDRLNMVGTMVLSPYGEHVVVDGHYAARLEALTGRRAGGFGGGRMGVRDVAYSADGKLLATAGVMDGEALRIFDGATTEQLRVCEQTGQRSLDAVAFSHDARWVVSLERGALEVCDVATGKPAGAIDALDENVAVVASSPTAPLLAAAGGRQNGGRSVVLLELPGGRAMGQLVADTAVTALSFAPDGKSLLVGEASGTMTLWKVPGLAKLAVLDGHEHPITAASFSPDGKRVVSGTGAGVVRVHTLAGDAQTAAPWVGFVESGTEWLMFGHDGYFDASRHGAGLVALVRGTHAFEPAQFAYRLNRPDILLRRIGLATPDLLAYLEGRHRLRLRKAGAVGRAVAAGLHAPTARILSAAEKGKTVELTVELGDDQLELASYNVYVNGVGLFGMRGKPLSGKTVRVTERVELTRGKNRIEVSCTNSAGAESFRAQTIASYDGKVEGAIYYLGFGVSKYRDERLDLAYAHADALALERMFKQLAPSRKVHTKVYVNEKVTARSIEAAKRFAAKAGVDDLFVLFLAGHGVHARDRDRTYYFVTHDTDVKRLAKTAADFELIEDLLVGIKPRRKLMLMDTCQSGEDAGPQDAAALKTAKARNIRVRNVRGLELVGPKAPARRAVPFDRNRYIENDLRRRSGAVVLSSSRGSELSFESDEARHGMFTKALLDAFRVRRADKDWNLRISADELLQYVTKEVAKATGGQQNPTIDRDNPFIDLELPVVEGSW